MGVIESLIERVQENGVKADASKIDSLMKLHFDRGLNHQGSELANEAGRWVLLRCAVQGHAELWWA